MKLRESEDDSQSVRLSVLTYAAVGFFPWFCFQECSADCLIEHTSCHMARDAFLKPRGWTIATKQQLLLFVLALALKHLAFSI